MEKNKIKEEVYKILREGIELDISNSMLSRILGLRQQSQLEKIGHNKNNDILNMAKLFIFFSQKRYKELEEDGKKIIYKGIKGFSKKELKLFFKDSKLFEEALFLTRMSEENKNILKNYVLEDSFEYRLPQLLKQNLITVIGNYTSLNNQDLYWRETYIKRSKDKFYEALKITESKIKEEYFFSFLLNESVLRTKNILNGREAPNKFNLGLLNVFSFTDIKIIAILIEIIDEGLLSINTFEKEHNFNINMILNYCLKSNVYFLFFKGKINKRPPLIKEIIKIKECLENLNKKTPGEIKNIGKMFNHFNVISVSKIDFEHQKGKKYSDIFSDFYPNEDYNKLYKLYKRKEKLYKNINKYWK